MNSAVNNFTLFPNCIDNKNNDVIDIANCCVEKCNKSYKLCEKSCINDTQCKNKCLSINENLCMDICQLASENLQIENDFYACARKNGCGENMDLPNLNCVMEQSKNIDNCVRSKWLPNKPNLINYNKFFNKLPFNPNPLINLEETDITENTNNLHKDNTLTYILIGIGITIFLSTIIIILNEIRLNFK